MVRLRRRLSSALALIAGVMLWASSKPPIVNQSLTTPRRGGAVLAAAVDPARSFNSGIPNAVAIKATPDSQGFFLLASDGKVYGYGDAVSLGDALLAHAPVTMAVTRDGKGYWVFDTNGCTAAFGDATNPAALGASICGTPLNGPVLDAAVTPSGRGYWLVANDGGMFAFGDAPFAGSMGGRPLNAPVVGMAPTPAGTGYWEVAADGGIFAFSAPFLGSMGSTHLNRPVVGMVASGSGYLMVGSDGGIFNFGNPFFGSLGASPPPTPIIATAPSFDNSGNPNGYWMLDRSGVVYGFGSAFVPANPLVIAGDGTFRVGSDILAGTYHTGANTQGCYWERLMGFSGNLSDVLANDIGNGPRVVTILSTDVGFKTSTCGGWTTSTAPTTSSPTAPLPGNGVFRVNIDIMPGTWTSTGNSGCYWARLSDFTGQNNIIANDIGDGTRIVTVDPKDVGLVVSGCTGWTKTG